MEFFVVFLTKFDGEKVDHRYLLKRRFSQKFDLVPSAEYEHGSLSLDKDMLVSARDLDDVAIQWGQRWQHMQLSVHRVAVGARVSEEEIKSWQPTCDPNRRYGSGNELL